ncbi:rCG54664 [Rattus norvegicus]|uniref:RCG54664 n=1 Tax=Rattus norvegicus TaxID=10116 RepID=A6KFK1_RAT|nr:rCG54664 [Rattus norvegicus]
MTIRYDKGIPHDFIKKQRVHLNAESNIECVKEHAYSCCIWIYLLAVCLPTSPCEMLPLAHV